MTSQDKKSNHYVVDLMESVLYPNDYAATMRMPSERTARAFLPYCIEPLGHAHLLLNRNYKPLGVSNRAWAQYDHPQYQSLTVPSVEIDISTLKHIGGGRYFFFHDGTSPFYGTCLDKDVYLIKLWLVFSRLGFRHPGLSCRKLNAAAKVMGVPVEDLYGHSISGEGML